MLEQVGSGPWEELICISGYNLDPIGAKFCHVTSSFFPPPGLLLCLFTQRHSNKCDRCSEARWMRMTAVGEPHMSCLHSHLITPVENTRPVLKSHSSVLLTPNLKLYWLYIFFSVISECGAQLPATKHLLQIRCDHQGRLPSQSQSAHPPFLQEETSVSEPAA